MKRTGSDGIQNSLSLLCVFGTRNQTFVMQALEFHEPFFDTIVACSSWYSTCVWFGWDSVDARVR